MVATGGAERHGNSGSFRKEKHVLGVLPEECDLPLPMLRGFFDLAWRIVFARGMRSRIADWCPTNVRPGLERNNKLDDPGRRHLARLESIAPLMRSIPVEADDVASSELLGKQPRAAAVHRPLDGDAPAPPVKMAFAVAVGQSCERMSKLVEILWRCHQGRRHSSQIPQPSSFIADRERLRRQHRHVIPGPEGLSSRSGGRISIKGLENSSVVTSFIGKLQQQD